MVPSSSMYDDAPICWRERHDTWSDEQSGHLFSYLSPEQRVPVVHPLRTIRAMTDDVLRRLSPRFDAIYAATGRPSIPPEHLLRTGTGWSSDACVVPATGTGERDTATSLIAGLPPRRVTIGGDKGYETRDFVKTFRT